MSRKLMLAAVLAACVCIPSAQGAEPSTLSPATLKAYANELNSAFPGQVDIYLLTKDFDFRNPSIADAHISGCAQVAGTLYYVVTMANKSETFVPQSQVVAIHNRK